LKRKVIDDLILWKNSNSGKPFLLTGAKGVGKTYVAYDFAKAFFERIFYINFERETGASVLFQASGRNDFSDRLFAYLKVKKDSLSESRIIILDELILNQKTVNLIINLKESGIFPNIITISSNPVSELIKGLFCHKQVFPLEFDEFLLATGNEWYIEAIMTHYETNKKIPEIVHKELLALHQEYMQIGGMPGIINEYLSLSSLVNVPEQHCLLISAYHDYILRDNQESEALKMNQVYDSLPLQLMKENKKFQYKLIRKGTTHSMYKDAIQKLVDHDYIIRCNKITAVQLNSVANPNNYDDFSKDDENTNFKLFLSDTGLLYTKLAEDKGEVLNEDITKALLENFVAQSLHNKGYQLAFWESDSMAKIDFLIRKDNQFLPIEIHSSDNTRSKSINVFKQKCDFPYAVKISSKNFEFSNQIKYVPYYAVFCL
jgi:predicted AAA+ superfamily ATPase